MNRHGKVLSDRDSSNFNHIDTHRAIFYNSSPYPRSIQDMLEAYVYWTAHHLDSWIKRDQLDVTCFIISLFTAQHVSGVNTSIFRSLRLICWVISWVVLLWFDACWCYVVVWLGWYGIWMLYVQSWTPDDGRKDCPKHVECHSKNKINLIHWFI